MSRRQIDSCGEQRIFLSDVCVCVCARPLYWCNFIIPPTLFCPLSRLTGKRFTGRSGANGVSVSSRSGGDAAMRSLIFSFTVKPRAQDDESHPSPGLCEISDNRQEGVRPRAEHKAHILTLGGLRPPNQLAPFSCEMCSPAFEPITTVPGSNQESSSSISHCLQL